MLSNFETNVVLTGLTAYTEYTVRVSGRNIFTPAAEAGNLFGGTSTFRTLPGGTHAVVTHHAMYVDLCVTLQIFGSV